jgi:hypothetical protein
MTEIWKSVGASKVPNLATVGMLYVGVLYKTGGRFNSAVPLTPLLDSRSIYVTQTRFRSRKGSERDSAEKKIERQQAGTVPTYLTGTLQIYSVFCQLGTRLYKYLPRYTSWYRVKVIITYAVCSRKLRSNK